MLLSVIIPYYNRNAWIGKTLDSLLDQDLDPSAYEIIVVDDGSDEDPVVLKDYANRYPNISRYPGGHHGPAVARNQGIAQAKGEWLYFCDSDDYVQSNAFGRILAAVEGQDVEMIITGFQWVCPGQPIQTPRCDFSAVSKVMTGLEYLKRPPQPFFWGLGNFFVRRDVLESKNILFRDIQFVEDRLFKLSLLPQVPRLVHIDVDLYRYVQHEDSVINAQRKRNMPAYYTTFPVFLERMTELSRDPATPPEASQFLVYRRNNAAYRMMTQAFHDKPEVFESFVPRLEAMGVYPFPVDPKDNAKVRLIKYLMNHRRLWPVLYRLFRLGL